MAARVWRGSTFNGPAECPAWEGIELGLDGSRRLRWDAINLPVTTVRFWPKAAVPEVGHIDAAGTWLRSPDDWFLNLALGRHTGEQPPKLLGRY